jgi:cysteinyl-tRNA synthetase
MSKKYLGETFDIHGGGLDLLFPHHESEIAQSVACSSVQPARYWMHHNMITVNGQKMAKSLNNGIAIDEFFSGNNSLLEQAYSPMTLKFFVLQAHYRGTLDFSNQALQASEKGLNRLLAASDTIKQLKISSVSTVDINSLETKCFEALADDLNTPILIAHLFELVTLINNLDNGSQSITNEDYIKLESLYNTYVFDLLGLKKEASQGNEKLNGVMKLVIELRKQAKESKNYAVSDAIRNQLTEIGIELKDGKEGTTFSF